MLGWEAVGVSWVPTGWMTGDGLGVDCFSVMYLHQNVLTLWWTEVLLPWRDWLCSMLLSWQPTTAKVYGAGPRGAQVLAFCQPSVTFVSPAPVLCPAQFLLQIPFFPSSCLNWGTNPSVLIAFLSSCCLQLIYSEVVVSNTFIMLMLIFICYCDPQNRMPCFSCILPAWCPSQYVPEQCKHQLFRLMVCALCSFFAFLHSPATPWS